MALCRAPMGSSRREPLPEDLDLNLRTDRAGAKGLQTHVPSRSEPKHSKVTSSEERLEQRFVARHDRCTARGKRVDQLRLGAGDVLHRTEKLEVDRPDARNHSDVGSGDRAKLGDLPEPAHPHLQDDHLCVGFDPAQRQRQADLVVLTPFRHHGTGLHTQLDLSELQEWTLEANPGSVSERKAQMLRELGVNRISLGVQSFDDGLLQLLGREHNAAQAEASFEFCVAAGSKI